MDAGSWIALVFVMITVGGSAAAVYAKLCVLAAAVAGLDRQVAALLVSEGAREPRCAIHLQRTGDLERRIAATEADLRAAIDLFSTLCPPPSSGGSFQRS